MFTVPAPGEQALSAGQIPLCPNGEESPLSTEGPDSFSHGFLHLRLHPRSNKNDTPFESWVLHLD